MCVCVYVFVWKKVWNGSWKFVLRLFVFSCDHIEAEKLELLKRNLLLYNHFGIGYLKRN